jgi:death-on-curing protein
MATPLWVEKGLLLQLHEEILKLTGGASGLRDENLLDSALARPLNQHAYDGEEDLLALAATYTVGVAKNHPFVDGNKRAAFACLGLFLLDNGLSLETSDEEAIDAMLKVAASEMDAEALTAWLKTRVVPK